MGNINLEYITLKEYTLDNLPLLNRLRQKLLDESAEICIERADWITRYYKNGAASEDSIEIRYAKAVNYFLRNKAALFFDDNLLAGSTTSRPFGAPVYPEYTGLHIWPELDTISTREQNPLKLTKKDAEALNFDIYPYWMERNILEYTRKKYNNPKCMRLFERIVFFLATKTGCISHTVPDYRLALNKGVEYIIESAKSRSADIEAKTNLSNEDRQQLAFYQAVQIAMDGVMAYARNLSIEADKLAEIENDPVKKANYQEMAKVCARVPAKPARTFSRSH